MLIGMAVSRILAYGDAYGFAQSADSRSSRPVWNAARGDLQGRCEDALAFRMPRASFEQGNST